MVMADPNSLINETSPYLLQHAHNPVNWFPWGKEAFDKARLEDKLVIVSIGYSSCHWCHVMEHESFEDNDVASMMNEHFVSIKVDREERPDIDHIYMTAVQLISAQGGWPLNCIVLPDGRPIWGGTYFPKPQWLEALAQVLAFYRDNREETLEYASGLEEGIRQSSIYRSEETPVMPGVEELSRAVELWSSKFDRENGGLNGSPKFPMPVTLDFLLHYGIQYADDRVLDHVELTLTRMARGGIYDQAGGGFARYSVDPVWKVPHFEKMLYDNGQLIGLYARAFQVFGKNEFEEVVRHSIEFLERDLLSPEGAFYAALDADSEGEEGKYYVWTREELMQITGEEFGLFSDYYNVNEKGLWENNRYILCRSRSVEEFAKDSGLEASDFRSINSEWKRKLLTERTKRVPPGLDDKSLTSWSSLVISGLVQAYRALGDEAFLSLALKGAGLIRERAVSGTLYRNYKNGKLTIPGFHIDYALFIESCLDLYEASMSVEWLDLALDLTESSDGRFFDAGSGMFFYNQVSDQELIANNMEVQDNVIPSSNSVMAHNLFRLGHLLEMPEYLDRAGQMLMQVSRMFLRYPNGFANWGRLLLKLINPYFQIAIVGPEAPGLAKTLSREYMPHALLVGSTQEQDLPLLRDRYEKSKTRIFVCRDNVCKLPLEKAEDAKRIFKIDQAQ